MRMLLVLALLAGFAGTPALACSVGTSMGNPIADRFIHPTAGHWRDSRGVISRLTYGDLDKRPIIHLANTARLDTGGEAGGPLALNVSTGGRPLASVRVDVALLGASAADQRAAVESKVREALTLSMHTGRIVNVTGACAL